MLSSVTMATITELKCALKETLEARGVLGQLKARIRAEVFNALDDKAEARPPLSHENLLINELIREYLEFNKYRHTASVLTAECGQPSVPLERHFIAAELNVVEEPSASNVPLLYGLISHFLSSTAENGDKLFLKNSNALAARGHGVGPGSDAVRAGYINVAVQAAKMSREWTPLPQETSACSKKKRQMTLKVFLRHVQLGKAAHSPLSFREGTGDRELS